LHVARSDANAKERVVANPVVWFEGDAIGLVEEAAR